MKKKYLNPDVKVVIIDSHSHLLTGSITATAGNANITYGGASSNLSDPSARVKDEGGNYSVWNDDWQKYQ